jgi:hypothetical protein
MDAVCPNCGDRLVDYRTDRQLTGGREVILNWTICCGCRHVGLKSWMVAHTANPTPRPQARRAMEDSPRRRDARAR